MTVISSIESAPTQVEEGKAHWRGPTDIPLMDETLGHALEHAAKQWPDQPAVKTSAGSWTFQQLMNESESLARQLVSLGLRKGDRLAIRLGNCIEYVLMLLACAKIGVITVVLNAACSPEQAIAAITHVTAKCILTSTYLTPPYKEARSDHSLLDALASSSLPWLIRVLYTGEKHQGCEGLMMPWTDLLKLPEGRFSGQALPGDIFNIQFTSGTTSSPKAVSLTHRSVLNNARHVAQRMDLGPSDVICNPFPLFHCSGLVVGLLASLLNGATVVLPSESFHPAKLLQAVKDEWPTVLHGVPTMFDAVIDLLGDSPLEQVSRLRTGLIGGSTLSSDLLGRIRKHLNLPGLISAYGMTEMSPLATSTCQSDSVDTHLSTVGRVVPHASIKVVSPNNLNETLATGERGEILVGGYLIMQGYWEDKAKTDQIVMQSLDGMRWLKTGDQGQIDERGYVKITGRLKDIIIRGGENIYPEEIEQCLEKHPDVSSAVVVGVPDDRLGEVVASFVQVAPGVEVDAGCLFSKDLRTCANGAQAEKAGKRLTPAAIREHVREHLAAYLVPKYVFWVSEMPLTGNGKIERPRLRSLALKAAEDLR